VEHASDITAETFLAATRKRDRYDPERASVRTWLYGFATKLVGEHRRTTPRGGRGRAGHPVRHGRIAAEPGQKKTTATLPEVDELGQPMHVQRRLVIDPASWTNKAPA
jgi:DNA-directed RNA polymerase specialized sigma24 family protein